MNQLKKIVKKHLVETKQNKIRQSKESMIISNRLNVLTERKKIITLNDVNKFFNDVIKEMVVMSEQGLDSKLINEGFFEFYTNLLDANDDTIKDYFKERMTNWLCIQLECENDMWSKNTIKEAIDSVSNQDTGRLVTDCEFTSTLLANAFIEKMKSSFKKNTDFSKSISNILKKSMLKLVDKHMLMETVKELIQMSLCNKLKELEFKMEDSVDKTKDKLTTK
jgi:hypothetical protein